MEHHGSLPKHLQISELLIREVVAGRLADGARLPPERDMAADLNVSVGTLRRALERMTELGMLTAFRALPAMSAARMTPSRLRVFRQNGQMAAGFRPRLSRLSGRTADDLITDAGCAHVLPVRRIRLLDDEPIALEEVWLDVAGAADLGPDSVSGRFI